MRKFVLLLAAVLASGAMLAQNRQVTGTVSGPDGNPMPGVVVMLQGTNTASLTDADGRYALSAPGDGVLEFSFLGMVTLVQPIGGREVVSAAMQQDAVSIDNVVVTALGITRSEKSLGYSVSSVNAESLGEGRESNVLNSLSGKVAGVNIMQNSGTAGGGSKIILRGQSSLSSAGQPLFVIDGVPVSNESYSHASGNNGAVDTGSRIGDLASDDIESMNVLKGAAATALYGARAKDGVVVITTKKGKKNQPASVSINSSLRIDAVLKLPDYQNVYAQGDPQTGQYDMGKWNGWGPRIEGQMVDVFFSEEQVPLTAHPDNVRDFFRRGVTAANSVSLSGGDEKNDFRLGISSFNQKGVVPRNRYDRYNFTFNGGRKFNDWFSGRVSATYVNSASEGRPAQGSNDKNIIVPTVMNMPRTMDTRWLREHWITADGKPYSLGGGDMATVNNPYWVLDKNKYTSSLDRVMGSVYLEVKPLTNLTVSNNLGVDFFYENSRRVWAKDTFGVPNGRFETVSWNGATLNNDLMATFEADICRDFRLRVLGGMNMLQITRKTFEVDAQNLLETGIYSYGNAEVTTPTNTYRQRRLVGLFGEIGVSYRDLAYLTVTGRNDWSSTMPSSHRSYFYPSVSGSVLLSELLPRNRALTFAKVRANFAMVGSDTDPYALSLTYGPKSTYFLQYIGSGTIPHGGLLGYSVNGIYPTAQLEPQMKREFEAGADLGFFGQRLRLGVTYYYNLSVNNIAAFDAPNSTGFYYIRKNAGKITNEGIEISLGATPVKGAFTWDVDVNFASNSQKVKSLDGRMTSYSLTSAYNGLQIKAGVGESFSIYGKGWERDPDGNIVVDRQSGLRKTTSGTINLGKIAPDFTMGISNSLSWKGVDVSFLVDIRQGGVMYSQTAGNMKSMGLGAETLLNDRQPIVDKGVNFVEATATTPAHYVANTTPVAAYDYWYRNFTSTNTEGHIYDASYVKLREVVAGYSLPEKWLGDFPLKSVFIGFEARNLWIIHSNVPHIDPELNMLTTGDIGYGVEFSGVPSTRSMGFNIKVTF